MKQVGNRDCRFHPKFIPYGIHGGVIVTFDCSHSTFHMGSAGRL